MTVLPDILAPGLKVVFCGTAASTISARDRAYYANPTNAFWGSLYTIGLTPRQFKASEFPQLLQHGIGLTDIAKHAQGNDSELNPSDFDANSLSQKIETYQPRMLAFTSKKGASVFFDKPTRKIEYGLQTEKLGTTHFWVLTSPSGAARAYWDETVWQALANEVGKISDS